jgi:excisionase family DNA binding protein
MNEDELITTDELATVLRVSTRFVRRLVAERRIEFVKTGRATKFTPAAVHDYIQRNTVRPMTRAELRRSLAGV